jgi:hypothetical protein
MKIFAVIDDHPDTFLKVWQSRVIFLLSGTEQLSFFPETNFREKKKRKKKTSSLAIVQKPRGCLLFSEYNLQTSYVLKQRFLFFRKVMYQNDTNCRPELSFQNVPFG